MPRDVKLLKLAYITDIYLTFIGKKEVKDNEVALAIST